MSDSEQPQDPKAITANEPVEGELIGIARLDFFCYCGKRAAYKVTRKGRWQFSTRVRYYCRTHIPDDARTTLEETAVEAGPLVAPPMGLTEADETVKLEPAERERFEEIMGREPEPPDDFARHARRAALKPTVCPCDRMGGFSVRCMIHGHRVDRTPIG